MRKNRKLLFCVEIGQERATIGFDDDVKITPFNIEEELDEGHYDETGCFHWKKKDVCMVVYRRDRGRCNRDRDEYILSFFIS